MQRRGRLLLGVAWFVSLVAAFLAGGLFSGEVRQEAVADGANDRGGSGLGDRNLLARGSTSNADGAEVVAGDGLSGKMGVESRVEKVLAGGGGRP